MHVSLPPRARQQRDGAQLDGDDARRHGGERRLSDDAPEPDASLLVPSWSFSPLLQNELKMAIISKWFRWSREWVTEGMHAVSDLGQALTEPSKRGQIPLLTRLRTALL